MRLDKSISNFFKDEGMLSNFIDGKKLDISNA